MKKNTRTLDALRSIFKGNIYIYLENEKIGIQFLKDAEEQGYRFGKIKPTDNSWSDIIALKRRNQLAYVGFVGHMYFQAANGEPSLTRIDYKKYISGDPLFLYVKKPCINISIKGKFADEIHFTGKYSFDSTEALKLQLDDCRD